MKQIFIFHTLAVLATSSFADTLHLNFRKQVETQPESGRYHTITESGKWDASKTAVVICDMWDDHYCRNAARRVSEMAPRMNRTIAQARKQGALIIHCPSGCMDKYAKTPQRRLAQNAPKVDAPIELQNWCYLDPASEPPMPVATDQPCDDEGKLRDRVRFYSEQIETLDIAEDDAITDSAEAYYLMKEKGIENVIIMGVHTNMCVLGRPFGIRQLVRAGQNVVLMRDMTDTMYNPREEPFVNHFTGNDLVFSHIERHWCPTITSADILPDESESFRFPGDKRKHIAIVMAEKEYKTNETLPKFAIEELGKDFKISLVYGDVENPNHLPGVEVIRDADVVLLSVRRRNLTANQLNLFRDHVAAGKPIIGIRTASHAFSLRNKKPPEGRADWQDFDQVVFGGNYTNHYGNDLQVKLSFADAGLKHSIVKGIDVEKSYLTSSSLYRVSPLMKGANVLMRGQVKGHPAEPVAWTYRRTDGGKSFYTSLGNTEDFQGLLLPALLENAMVWGLSK